MPIPHFIPATSSTPSSQVHSTQFGAKGTLGSRAISITSAKIHKGVRKAKNLAKRPAVSVGWYEAEDRTLPSVSSF